MIRISKYDQTTIDHVLKLTEYVEDIKASNPEQGKRQTANEILNKISDSEWDKIYHKNTEQEKAQHPEKEAQKN